MSSPSQASDGHHTIGGSGSGSSGGMITRAPRRGSKKMPSIYSCLCTNVSLHMDHLHGHAGHAATSAATTTVGSSSTSAAKDDIAALDSYETTLFEAHNW
jgi:hypothetical protein